MFERAKYLFERAKYLFQRGKYLFQRAKYLFQRAKYLFQRAKYLFAGNALLSELLLVARGAVHITSFGEETLRSDWPFTLAAGEALVVPGVAFVRHALCAWDRKTGWLQSEPITRITSFLLAGNTLIV